MRPAGSPVRFAAPGDPLTEGAGERTDGGGRAVLLADSLGERAAGGGAAAGHLPGVRRRPAAGERRRTGAGTREEHRDV